MEFLLINHPLDCPICDQGGECELQDVSMGYGGDVSRFNEGKRVVKDKNIGPLIATDMTRCIQCTRCVRFGEEIAGMPEMGATGRGEHMEIGTYIERSVDSELSGNMIDVCPVGALTSKPFRFKARAWELTQRATIAGHDCVGSHIFAHISRNKVMRVVPKEEDSINEVWISDRDRFSYEALYAADRITTPMIKHNDEWRETSWEEAIQFAKNGLQRVAATKGMDKLGALTTASATVEEGFLLQKFMRSLGSMNCDFRLRQQDFSNPSHQFPSLGCTISELEHSDVILLIGSNIRKDQPMLSHRLRKASQHGAKIIAINPIDFDFNFPLAHKKIVAGGDLASALSLDNQEPWTKILSSTKQCRILLGPLALQHPQADFIRSQAAKLAEKYHATLGILTEGPNAAGLWQIGMLPHQGLGGKTLTDQGMNAKQMCCNPALKGLILMGVELDRDTIYGEDAMNTAQAAEFVVSLSSYRSENLMQISDVILPITPYFETAGTYVNVEGRWQSFQAVTMPLGESRPAWKVLRVLGNLFELPGFDQISAADVLKDVQAQLALSNSNIEANSKETTKVELPQGLIRIAEMPTHGGDAILRRANALQNTKDNQLQMVKINTTTAAEYGLLDQNSVRVIQEGRSLTMPLMIDSRIPNNSVYLANASSELSLFCKAYSSVRLERVQS